MGSEKATRTKLNNRRRKQGPTEGKEAREEEAAGEEVEGDEEAIKALVVIRRRDRKGKIRMSR